MSQHDFNIANQTASNARADINNALKALASLSSGSTAPSTTYANMLWYDTVNNILKMRAEADDTWINIGYLDQSADAFRILDNTQVVNTSGTQTGLLGDQSEATWETGTSTTESLVSPAKVKAAIEALAGGGGFASIQVFETSGTWNRPADVTKVLMYVTGGGAGASEGSPTAPGGDAPEYPGGSGATAIKFLDVSSISSATITVGSGSADGGGDGGDSSWSDGTNTVTGGGGQSGSLYAGGTASGGDLNIPGGAGLDEGGCAYYGGYGSPGSGAAQNSGGNDGVVVILEYK